MMRKLVATAASAALCLSTLAPSVAAAQEYRFTGFDAPRGATATMNLRVPLGAQPDHRRPSLGFSAGVSQEYGADLSGVSRTREMRIADLRIDADGLPSARLVGVDLNRLDEDPRLGIVDSDGSKKSVVWIIGAIFLGAAAACIFWICDGDDEDSDSPSSLPGGVN